MIPPSSRSSWWMPTGLSVDVPHIRRFHPISSDRPVSHGGLPPFSLP
ncbi:hypothetical protein [Kibdelosporangium philippinense]